MNYSELVARRALILTHIDMTNKIEAIEEVLDSLHDRSNFHIHLSDEFYDALEAEQATAEMVSEFVTLLHKYASRVDVEIANIQNAYDDDYKLDSKEQAEVDALDAERVACRDEIYKIMDEEKDDEETQARMKLLHEKMVYSSHSIKRRWKSGAATLAWNELAGVILWPAFSKSVFGKTEMWLTNRMSGVKSFDKEDYNMLTGGLRRYSDELVAYAQKIESLG